VWLEILTPMTLAFSGEVVYEKLGKSSIFVKVTAKKSVAPFYIDTVYIAVLSSFPEVGLRILQRSVFVAYPHYSSRDIV